MLHHVLARNTAYQGKRTEDMGLTQRSYYIVDRFATHCDQDHQRCGNGVGESLTAASGLHDAKVYCCFHTLEYFMVYANLEEK